MSRDPANAGAVAFKRAGDPNVGEFSDAVVLKKFGDVPNDLSELMTKILLLHHDQDGRGVFVSSPDPCRVVNLIGFADLAMYCRKCSNSVAMGAIADVADARSKRHCRPISEVGPSQLLRQGFSCRVVQGGASPSGRATKFLCPCSQLLTTNHGHTEPGACPHIR